MLYKLQDGSQANRRTASRQNYPEKKNPTYTAETNLIVRNKYEEGKEKKFERKQKVAVKKSPEHLRDEF